MPRRTFKDEDYDFMKWMNGRADYIHKEYPLPFRRPRLSPEDEMRAQAAARREALRFPSDPFVFNRMMHYFHQGIEELKFHASTA